MTTNTREIKFRAWDSRVGRWYVSYNAPFEWLGENEKAPEVGVVTYTKQRFPDGIILMQYTGLKDKNGKEIYEGDLLLVLDEEVVSVTDEGYGPIESCNHIASVVFRNGAFCINIPDTDSGMTGLYSFRQWNEEVSDEEHEIIGNIYENSDLLV